MVYNISIVNNKLNYFNQIDLKMKSKYNIITRKAKYINSKSIKEILIKLKKA